MRILVERLDHIRDDIIEIHKLAQESVELCLEGLRGDEEARKRAIRIEHVVDVMNTEIDCKCISTLALFHPLARDLRFVLSMIKISGNYERITDLSSEIAIYTAPDLFNGTIDILARMREKILEMFKELEKTLKTGNTRKLKDKLLRLEDKIDFYYIKSIEKLMMEAENDNSTSEDVIDMALIARHLERIGDILTKTGSRYIFIEEGRRVWIK